MSIMSNKWEKFTKDQEASNEAAKAEEELQKNQAVEEESLDQSSFDGVADDVLTEAEATGFNAQDDLANEITAMEKKLASYADAAVRAKAEVENMKRRMEREVQNANKFGTEKLIKSLVPVLDSLSQGLEGNTESDDPPVVAMREGMEMTQGMLLKSLKDSGLVVVDPEIGEVFNPERHEAMSIQSMPGAEPNTVTQVLRKGYELNGRVLRAAMVMVTAA